MRSILCSILVVAALACGSSGGGDSSDASTATGECSMPGTSQCEGGQVCEPVGQTCESPQGECAEQAECTGGLYCETAAGVCLPSTVGTPCAGPENCDGNCLAGICGCDGVVNGRQLGGGPLDIYLMLDRSASMLDGPVAADGDCAYTPGTNPPEHTKGCYATYALADYVINQIGDSDDARLAFDVMSLHNDCDGVEHDDPEIDMTRLPVPATHNLVTRISDEDFDGGFGTQIEGALKGIALYTGNPANVTAGREMIGVFITDGEPTNDCVQDVDVLDDILIDHRNETGVRTFIIGMTGADEEFLEQLAIAGGADPHMDYCGGINPPCHYFNVGDGEGSVLAEALQAIQQQAVDIPCNVDVSQLQAPEGESVDYSKVNVSYDSGTSTTNIGKVDDASACPSNGLAWYYDDSNAPTEIILCPNACDAVQDAGEGANLAVVVGCNTTSVFID